jgi:spoIIIJ-associated protein
MPIEIEAKSVEEAMERICEELGKKREELEFEVIEEKSRGIFGLMGNKRVRVRGRLKGVRPPDQEEAEAAQEGAQGAGDALSYAKTVLERILAEITVPSQVQGRLDGETIYLDIKGDGTGLLIGRHGQTLDAIQYIVGRIVGKQLGEKKVIVIDTEKYRERRRENLERLSRQMGEKAKSTGRPVSLQLMSASDRRIVHLALKHDRDLETRSEGEGSMKSIKIIPRKRRS